MPDLPSTAQVVLAAGIGGCLFGAVSQATGFCAMGAVSDLVLFGDRRRLRAWLLAAAVALFGAQALQGAGLVDLGQSAYLAAPTLPLAGALLGGLAFGIGMTLAGGCGAKSLVRLGGGNLKALLVLLVMGISAMATLKGVLAPLRQGFERLTALPLSPLGLTRPSLPALLEGAGLPPAAAVAVAVAGLGGGLAWWCLKDSDFRRSPADLGGGVAIGLLVPAGWATTGILGADPFEPAALASFSFVAPIGAALVYLMTATGASLSFAVASVGGVVIGAFAVACRQGRFQLETFTDRADFLRHLAGAALMGTGGVLAMGCTIGQGVTGLSTLALASPLALAGLILGAMIGLKRLETGSTAAALGSLLCRR